MRLRTIRDLTPEQAKALKSWLDDEGLKAGDILDDGRFSVHNGRVSGSKILRDSEDQLIVNIRRGEILTVPFNVKQKNPFPEELIV